MTCEAPADPRHHPAIRYLVQAYPRSGAPWRSPLSRHCADRNTACDRRSSCDLRRRPVLRRRSLIGCADGAGRELSEIADTRAGNAGWVRRSSVNRRIENVWWRHLHDRPTIHRPAVQSISRRDPARVAALRVDVVTEVEMLPALTARTASATDQDLCSGVPDQHDRAQLTGRRRGACGSPASSPSSLRSTTRSAVVKSCTRRYGRPDPSRRARQASVHTISHPERASHRAGRTRADPRGVDAWPHRDVPPVPQSAHPAARTRHDASRSYPPQNI